MSNPSPSVKYMLTKKNLTIILKTYEKLINHQLLLSLCQLFSFGKPKTLDMYTILETRTAAGLEIYDILYPR